MAVTENDDEIKELRKLLDMPVDEYTDTRTVIIEAIRKIETLESPAVQAGIVDAESKRFSDYMERRINTVTREYARWLESSENERRDLAATAIFDQIMMAVDTCVCHLKHATDGHGKRMTPQKLIEWIWESCESALESVGIEHTSGGTEGARLQETIERRRAHRKDRPHADRTD